ncbi:hypothetical protein Leryth_016797 [Lithospermum erythrorhizon]|nr:hypothetical protein Leryth_016797 [Lithospermum erythrorhizon]
MTTLHRPPPLHLHPQRPKLFHFRKPNSFPFPKKLLFSRKLLFSNKIYGVLLSNKKSKKNGHFVCVCKASGAELESVLGEKGSRNDEEDERPPFDINLAVILAGFAFEAYTTPPENVGKREVDAANCQTVFLSELFVREIYDGQLFIKLKKGINLPAMDPWGTSDPYVVLQLDGQIVKSKIKWGTKEPTWNEEFSLNIKPSSSKILQVAAWDANLVTPHKRMGNAGVELEAICDGEMHEVMVELEGIGGGGKIQLEVKFKSFEKIDEEKDWWRIPFVTDFLQKHGFESALKNIVGSESIQARQFVEFAFGQLKSRHDSYIQKNILVDDQRGRVNSNSSFNNGFNGKNNDTGFVDKDEQEMKPDDMNAYDSHSDVSPMENHIGKDEHSDKQFWKNLAKTVDQNIVQRFGLPVPDKIKWDAFDLLNNIGVQSQNIAEAGYIESGLATPKDQEAENEDAAAGTQSDSSNQSSQPDMKKVKQDLLKQTDAVLGALMVLNATVSQFSKGAGLLGKSDIKEEVKSEAENKVTNPRDGSVLDDKNAEEMRDLFSKAESAMEAWAMLATALGHPSFIKSEFVKICFLDNPSTDTQVALWRDLKRKRLVVAFRGTEQTKWKDLLTDLMLVPAGLNPERIGTDSKQEVQVHSGFLSAYDSVRTRLILLIKQAVGYMDRDDDMDPLCKWHVYVTGHSLGGALATLLALELTSGQLAKSGAISVTMYNFGSPRVGNRKFAEVYNKKIKDSWRVVNHRDIIPTVPRLMGYCHVAQPIYLAARNLKDALENVEPMEDGYQSDVIGEATPDDLVSEFMKGEKQLVEKILNTEINIFRAIRDGSALMQHMEDFYYITLLENVRSNYQTVPRPQLSDDNSL